MTVYLEEFKQEKASFEEENRLYHEQQEEEKKKQEELRQEQIRVEKEYIQKMYYHYFSNTQGKYLQIIPDTYDDTSYLKSNLPRFTSSISVESWGYYYDMQNKHFIIYREYSDGRTYNEYLIEDIYTINELTYVKIYCFADGMTYLLSSNYKIN